MKKSVSHKRSPLQVKGPTKYIQPIAFFAVLYLMAFISLMIPLRPTYSAVEKRELTKFPSFSIVSLANGSFFDGISTWFSDTFPFREGFISANASFQKLFGFSGKSISGDVQQGDVIPTAPMTTVTSVMPTTPSDAPTTTTAAPTRTTRDPKTVPIQTNGAILIYGDSGYEYYNFVQSTADNYIGAVNRAAANLAGKASVYDIIIPTSMDICVPEVIRADLNTSNQKQAIDYMYGSMSAQVNRVNIFDTLQDFQNKGEYLYFRTDHHWTAQGAYRTYELFSKACGRAPAALDSFKKWEFPGYLGSFYSDSEKNPALSANPDTVYAYEPPQTNTIITTEKGGEIIEYPVIYDETGADSSFLYGAFLAGDHPFGVITNPQKNDGSACILIKESFGNAFAPFLVPDYQTVYVVDYRYFNSIDSRSLTQLVDDTGAKTVLFLNNISATRNDGLVDAISELVG